MRTARQKAKRMDRQTDRQTDRRRSCTTCLVTSRTVHLSRVFVSRESRAYFHVIKASRSQPFHSRDVTSCPIEQMTFIIHAEIIWLAATTNRQVNPLWNPCDVSWRDKMANQELWRTGLSNGANYSSSYHHIHRVQEKKRPKCFR